MKFGESEAFFIFRRTVIQDIKKKTLLKNLGFINFLLQEVNKDSLQYFMYNVFLIKTTIQCHKCSVYYLPTFSRF